MATASKQYNAFKQKFRAWLLLEMNNVDAQLMQFEEELGKYPYELGTDPLSPNDITQYNMALLPIPDERRLIRLGLLYQGYRHFQDRHRRLSHAFDGEAPHIEMAYEEFRKAIEGHEHTHHAMLQELVFGLKDELHKIG